MKAAISYRHGYAPPELGEGFRLRYPIGTGFALPDVAPVRLRALPSRVGEMLRASFAAAKDEAVNAPTDADKIVTAQVRLLSCELIAGYYIDHTDPAPLKRAVPQADRLPVYTMHWADPGRWCGMVTEPEWDPTPMGPQKAPGINGYVCIESDLPCAEALARGVLRRSTNDWSVGMVLDYHASHDEMAAMDPYKLCCVLGTTAPDGEIYRFIVDEIVRLYELSAVDMGACQSAVTIDARAPTQPIAARKPAPVPASRPRGAFVAATPRGVNP